MRKIVYLVLGLVVLPLLTLSMSTAPREIPQCQKRHIAYNVSHNGTNSSLNEGYNGNIAYN
jgi:hypothetical protein